MRVARFWFLALALALIGPANIGAQRLEGLTGSWTLQRSASTFGPGDPGAERIEILVSANEVRVARFFGESPQPSVWTLALDGSPPPPPQVGTARVVDGTLAITHDRAREVVTNVYTVDGDTLRVERSVQSKAQDAQPLKHVMVFKRHI